MVDVGKAKIYWAVDFAEEIFDQVSKISVKECSKLMFKLAEMIENNTEKLAILASKESGRYITEMRNDFTFAVEQIWYFASVGFDCGDFVNTLNRGYMIGKRVPYGVIRYVNF